MNLLSLKRNKKNINTLNINRFFKFKKLNQTNFLVIGHRGARGLAPENTIASFEKAIELEVDAIELDVVISKDKKVVVSHEAWMNHEICLKENGKRISHEEEKLHNLFQMDYSKIKKYNCGSLKHPSFDDQETEETYKPLLKDALQMIEFVSKIHEQDVACTIEIKSDSSTDHIFHPPPQEFVELVINSISGFPKEKINLRSFDYRVLKEIKSRYPEYSTCLISDTGKLQEELNLLGYTPEIYSPNFKVLTKSLIKKCKKKKMQVLPWTVNEFEELREILLLGVDGVITDYPNKAIRLRNRYQKLKS